MQNFTYLLKIGKVASILSLLSAAMAAPLPYSVLDLVLSAFYKEDRAQLDPTELPNFLKQLSVGTPFKLKSDLSEFQNGVILSPPSLALSCLIFNKFSNDTKKEVREVLSKSKIIGFSPWSALDLYLRDKLSIDTAIDLLDQKVISKFFENSELNNELTGLSLTSLSSNTETEISTEKKDLNYETPEELLKEAVRLFHVERDTALSKEDQNALASPTIKGIITFLGAQNFGTIFNDISTQLPYKKPTSMDVDDLINSFLKDLPIQKDTILRLRVDHEDNGKAYPAMLTELAKHIPKDFQGTIQIRWTGFKEDIPGKTGKILTTTEYEVDRKNIIKYAVINELNGTTSEKIDVRISEDMGYPGLDPSNFSELGQNGDKVTIAITTENFKFRENPPVPIDAIVNTVIDPFINSLPKDTRQNITISFRGFQTSFPTSHENDPASGMFAQMLQDGHLLESFPAECRKFTVEDISFQTKFVTKELPEKLFDGTDLPFYIAVQCIQPMTMVGDSNHFLDKLLGNLSALQKDKKEISSENPRGFLHITFRENENDPDQFRADYIKKSVTEIKETAAKLKELGVKVTWEFSGDLEYSLGRSDEKSWDPWTDQK